MTDIRRTVLWVVFTMSLVLLWDGWQKHNGHPSMFSPAVPKPVAAAGSAVLPSPAVVPAAAAATATPSAGAAPVAAASEKIVISTDVVKATLDSQGGSLVRVELLQHKDDTDPSGHVIVLDRSPQRVYLAQTGLVGVPDAPTHFSMMTAQPGERVLKEGAQAVEVRFESPEQGGLKLVKTYTFKRGDYAVAVKHEVLNVGAAAVNPQLYVQLVRDGNAGPGESSFYSTFTGPAIYTEKAKFQKVDFKDIEKAKTDHEKMASDGWVAMVQHYYASAWLHNAASPREFFAKKVDSNLYSVGMVFPLGQVEPGKSAIAEDTLFVGPQEENKLAALAPGLELVKDYGCVHASCPSRCSGCWTSCTSCSATGAGPSSPWWCC